MPANKKYLTKSPWTKLARILTGVVGGYLVTISFHAAFFHFLPKEIVMVTSFITAYLLWAILLLFAFLIKEVWKTLAIYTLLIIVFSAIYIIPIS